VWPCGSCWTAAWYIPGSSTQDIRRFVFQQLPEPNRVCLVGVYAVTLDPLPGMGTSRQWPRPRWDRDVSLPRPRRDRDVWAHQPRRDRDETFTGLETLPRRWSARLLSLMQYTTKQVNVVGLTVYCRYTVTACPLISWPLHCPYTAVYSSICTVMYTIVYTAVYGM